MLNDIPVLGDEVFARWQRENFTSLSESLANKNRAKDGIRKVVFIIMPLVRMYNNLFNQQDNRTSVLFTNIQKSTARKLFTIAQELRRLVFHPLRPSEGSISPFTTFSLIPSLMIKNLSRSISEQMDEVVSSTHTK